MKAIVTKYHGATNTRGSRMSAKAEGVPSISVPYDHDLGTMENHAAVAKKLKDKYKWSGPMTGGGLPNGDFAWTFKGSYEINPKARDGALTFKDLSVNDTFDFVAPNEAGRFNSFYDRCIKTSARKYKSLETGIEYTVGSYQAKVYHVKSATHENPSPRDGGRTAYIRRKSQITKKPPVKRLKKRRAKNWDRPTKGRFPNPIQKAEFSNGGFVLHKVTLPDVAGTFSAWYDASGKLLDAEQRTSSGVSRTVKPGGKAWLGLESRGRIHKNPAPRGFVIYAQGTGKRMNFDGTKFSERTPKIYGNARAAEGAAMNMLAKYPVLKKYKVWVGPESPKA